MEEKNEKVRIVIEFHGSCQRAWAINEIKRIQQAVMNRDPLEEPYVYAEVLQDDGETWERDKSI